MRAALRRIGPVLPVAAALALIVGVLPTQAAAQGTVPPPTTAPAAPAAGPEAATQGAADDPRRTGVSPTLSETTRLADRRATVIGDRGYAASDASGLYPALGFHTRGEMGGVWSPPIKLLDGLWFRVDGAWLGSRAAPAQRFTSGWGYHRIDYRAGAVDVTRTDLVPDGRRGLLVGLTFTATGRPGTVALALDAHSELMSAYPWGESTPGQTTFNLPDTAAVAGSTLVFRETGTPPVPNAAPHDWAAVVGSSARPTGSSLSPDNRGPQDPPVVCGASGPATPAPPARCDDTAYGKGTGGQLTYSIAVAPRRPTTLWFAVGGSETGPAEATAAVRSLLAEPVRLLAAKVVARRAVAARTQVTLPGDPRLAQAVEWYKQNLADSVQEVRDLRLRVTSEGTQYPAPAGTLPVGRWYGAGWPDYPWLFGTDGEYTAFAALAAGQFETVAGHLRTLRDVSEVVNDRSGKVVHEVVSTGDVYFGSNDSAGNTDESAKFPSAVAVLWRFTGDDRLRDEFYDFSVRTMRYVVDVLDTDKDGWPEGLGNVERDGMGPEKLDNAVYTVRGLRDLQDMALSRNDAAVATWANDRATALEQRFEADWWFGGDTDSYADSRDGATGTTVYQRHWIGLTPTDAVLRRPGQPDRPLASQEHALATLGEREQDCYSVPLGMWHTGTGPTSAGANPGPSCDTVVSSVPSERNAFSLTTSIIAVSEANLGRMGPQQLPRYTTALARIQLDPSVWELPGASPEIAPGGDFVPNIDQPFVTRSSVLQAWGSYGVLWPVVHHQLGIDPDLGRGALTVVPQVPDGRPEVAGRNVRLAGGAVDVQAFRQGGALRTVVTPRGLGATLTIGALLPAGATPRAVTLDGRPVPSTTVATARGAEVRVTTDTRGRHELVVRTA